MFKQVCILLTGFLIASTAILAAEKCRPVPDHTLPVHYRLNPPYPTIKILVAKDVNSIEVEADGPYRVFNPADSCVTGYGLFGKCYPVHATEDGLKWGESFPSTYQIAIVPASNKTQLFVDGVAYTGSIFVYQIGNKVNIVNQTKVEDYLKCTLPTKLDCNLKDEAMAAAVIAARTDIYYKALRHEKAFFQVDAKEVGYHGLDCIKSRNVDRAVDATRYLVMKCDDCEYLGLFPATWTEHSAGKTACASAIFRRVMNGPKEGVESAIAASDREVSSWSLFVKKKELAKTLSLKDITSVSACRDFDSSKVFAVRFSGNDGAKEEDFFKLQNLLGKEKLLSTDFDVELQGDLVAFSGHGKGHGVGLCLFSANKLAEHGTDAVKVLHKFFPSTEVVMMPTLHPQQTELHSFARD